MGELPDWYKVIHASRYLGVEPWALAKQPEIWQQWAFSAEKAEGDAEHEIKRREQRKQGRKSPSLRRGR